MSLKPMPYFLEPSAARRALPIIISSPHSGTAIPPDIGAMMDPDVAARTEDTDWFVHELYGFAPRLGVTLIHAKYNRYVVDLNRDPAGAKLYTDGRQETGLCPVKTFALAPIYQDKNPSRAEIDRRTAAYFQPYHEQITALIADLRKTHRHVLLWDAHSIKRVVQSVSPERFADVILGDQKGKTAAASLVNSALLTLKTGTDLDVAHNVPFMGGYITRSFGAPDKGVHALQLEMSQDVYMDEARNSRDDARRGRMQPILENTLVHLAEQLAKLP